jgi:hypothetical protein
MLAVILGDGRPAWAKAALWGAAVLIALIVALTLGRRRAAMVGDELGGRES